MYSELRTALVPFITALAALIAALCAIYEIKRTARAHSTFILIETNKTLRKIRPLYQMLWDFPEDYHKWNSKQDKIADLVGTELQRISYLCMTGLVDKKVIIELQGKVIVDSWNKSKEWTKDYREKYSEPRELKNGAWRRKYFELFAEECKNYLTKKGYYRINKIRSK